MMKTFIFLLISVVIIGMGFTLSLAYWAGHWAKISFVGVEAAGFAVIATGTVISLLYAQKTKVLRRITRNPFAIYLAFVFVIGVLVLIRAASFNLLIRAYAAGFEKRVLEIAPISQWESLRSPAQAFFLTKHTNNLESMLPAFVRSVYSNSPPYCGVSGDPGDIDLVVLWRQSTLVIGITIGHHGSLSNELYRKRCADDMAIVVAR
ncbi:MAG TPA: hypothetical protein VH413_10570 [Verrucomicrobiae bacterium]|jgi:hypothetical protein|nr:hypothetical protein [Verrucomicrobiae bacterium]